MKKTKLIEHQVIAHCTAFLISKKVKIDNIAVARKHHVPEVIKIIKNDLVEKYKFSSTRTKEIIQDLKFNKTRDDILGTYYHRRKYPNKKIKIEAKGGNVMYAIYTSIGQLACSRERPSSYWWFGYACPNTWQKYIYDRMTFEGLIKPIINDFISHTRSGQGLWFYFVDEEGFVKSVTWKKFLSKKTMVC